MNNFAKRVIILLLLLPTVSLLDARDQAAEGDADNVVVRAVLNRNAYRAGDSATVRFTILNRGSKPIYVSHGNLDTCGRWTGYTEIRIFSGTAEVRPKAGCHAAVLPVEDSHLKEVLTNSNSWIALFPGEIYGEEQLVDVPPKAGEYKLAAEVQPPRFSEAQLKILEREHIRVMRQPHAAPALSFKVQSHQ